MVDPFGAMAAAEYATETFSYDGHGNMTTLPPLRLVEWDHRHQLRASSTQDVSVGVPETTWYVYDAAGERVRKVTDGPAPSTEDAAPRSERRYLGGFEIYREYGPTGAVTLVRTTVHIGDGTRLAMVETRVGGGPAERLVRYQYGNQIGSSTVELDAAGALISYEEYYPYGSTALSFARSGVPAKRYRYSAKERDEETGLSYHGARYYAPWLARWTSADPSGTSAGLNGYSAMGCSPVTLHDPDGRDPETVKEAVKTAAPLAPLVPTATRFVLQTSARLLPAAAESAVATGLQTSITMGAGTAATPLAAAPVAAAPAMAAPAVAAGAGVEVVGLGAGGLALGAGAIILMLVVFAAPFCVFIGGDKYGKMARELNAKRQREPVRKDPGPPEPPRKDPVGDDTPRSLPPAGPPSDTPVGDEPTDHPGVSAPGPESDVGRVFEFAPVVLGGAKWKIKGGKKHQGHHIPAWDAIKRSNLPKTIGLTYGRAPAARLLTDDHAETETHGVQGLEGALSRDLQKHLIDDGQFDVAQDLDIEGIVKRDPGVYNKEILQALDWSIELGLRPDYGEWGYLFDELLNKLGTLDFTLKHFK